MVENFEKIRANILLMCLIVDSILYFCSKPICFFNEGQETAMTYINTVYEIFVDVK